MLSTARKKWCAGDLLWTPGGLCVWLVFTYIAQIILLSWPSKNLILWHVVPVFNPGDQEWLVTGGRMHANSYVRIWMRSNAIERPVSAHTGLLTGAVCAWEALAPTFDWNLLVIPTCFLPDASKWSKTHIQKSRKLSVNWKACACLRVRNVWECAVVLECVECYQACETFLFPVPVTENTFLLNVTQIIGSSDGAVKDLHKDDQHGYVPVVSTSFSLVDSSQSPHRDIEMAPKREGLFTCLLFQLQGWRWSISAQSSPIHEETHQ